MNSDDFKKAAQNPNLISGVYNYCNRWCEKCNFTKRCMLASFENANNQKDEENIFQGIKKSFDVAIELLNEWAEKEGVDLDYIAEHAADDDFEKSYEEIKTHPLSEVSMKYAEMLNLFLKTYSDQLLAEQEDLINQVKRQVLPTNVLEQDENFKNALAIVRWYHIQIHAKLVAAVSGIEFDPTYEDEIQNHGNGSAKVALLGTEESIGAMGVLLQSFPEYQDEILPILAQLERIRNSIKHYFPKVEQFKRPGFDD